MQSYADHLFFLCYPSALVLLFVSFRSKEIAFSKRQDNVFTIKFQRKIVKFHIDIRKRRVRILLIARKFVILHSIIKPWSSCCIRVVQKTSPRAFTFLQDCSQSHAKQRQNQRSSFYGLRFCFFLHPRIFSLMIIRNHPIAPRRGKSSQPRASPQVDGCW